MILNISAISSHSSSKSTGGNSENEESGKRTRRHPILPFGAAISFLLLLLVFLSGCEDLWLPVSKKKWSVGNMEISEDIEASRNNWPDRVYSRTYSAIRDGKSIAIGNYQNESKGGVVKEPFQLNGEVFLFSTCYSYWKSLPGCPTGDGKREC